MKTERHPRDHCDTFAACGVNNYGTDYNDGDIESDLDKLKQPATPYISIFK